MFLVRLAAGVLYMVRALILEDLTDILADNINKKREVGLHGS